MTGHNLWSEYNLEKVLHFLDELYGANQLDYHGLTEKSAPHRHKAIHDIEVFHEKVVDDHKYDKNEQGFHFWGPMDISLCFSIYVLSAAILMVVYFKFVAKRKPCFGISQFFHRTNDGPMSMA